MRQLVAVACAAMAVLTQVPNAVAANEVPDLDPLFDDSGPLPGTVGDLSAIPDLAFTTASGVACRKSHGKLTHSVACVGNVVGAPPGTRSVSLGTVAADGSGPAQFLPMAPAGLLGDPGKVPLIMLAPGHKIVFWDFSPTESLVCGAPLGTEVACVLKASRESGAASNGAAVTHGFVIAAPQSEVF
ncbi:hypothetical protein [Mycolicibacter arupensis]|uniref:Secreted protein n=1 Tax=Mycolicibacter arupensis TaxID=342002 RepID=A0A5B1M8S3_9MYCO|nr:hypothetical protein [Mycolicibacter arupensis]KAA1429735.1 hypothetical protein F0402_17680 [Mycolicibacter arupensis]TXI50765.1 MAG: hypothetical protein E6Q54_21315 [Mycolicibacter arupensis]